MNVEDLAKRRGRKGALPPEQRKRETFTFRVRTDLRNRMEERAASKGRSLSEEIEDRLENSFTFEKVATHEFVAQMAKAIEASNLKDEYISRLRDVARISIKTHSEAMRALQSVSFACEHFALKQLTPETDPKIRAEVEEALATVRESVGILAALDFSKIDDVLN